jgi:hypothetical protein
MPVKMEVILLSILIILLQCSATYSQSSAEQSKWDTHKIIVELGDTKKVKLDYMKYVKQGNYQKAYEELLKFKELADSNLIRNFKNYAENQQLHFQAAEKERRLELLAINLEKNRYIMYGLGVVIFLIVLSGSLFLRQLKLKEKQRISDMNNTIAELTQKNLRQQMNPHFIFNTLNSIQYYMYQNDKISTNNYLTKFSNLIRKILENSEKMNVPIQSELDAIELYLELESMRFKDKFDYEITVDENLDTLVYQIPAMFIQPFVENAVVHGLFNKEGKGSLKINMQLKDDFVECIIADNGIGHDAAEEIRKNKNGNHISLGTKITESRLNLINELYGKNMKIIYTDFKDENGKPGGTRVNIYIPIMAGI